MAKKKKTLTEFEADEMLEKVFNQPDKSLPVNGSVKPVRKLENDMSKHPKFDKFKNK